jgi:DNA invertase Pin-like site-specific DNA recombinase
MIADIEAGNIGIVLCKDLSRLGRNNALVAYYTEIHFVKNRVRLIALNDGIDSDKGDNEIMPFKSVINEYYARDISKKVRSAKRTQAQRGEFYGSFAPYGYVKSPDDKHKFIVDEESASVVRRMFKLAADGKGVYQIAEILSEERVLIPRAYKTLKLGFKQDKFDHEFPWDWQTTTVKRILENRAYIGDMVNCKQSTLSFKVNKTVQKPEQEWVVVKGTHEPLVDEDTFEKVQKIIRLKKRANKINKPNLFAGILICADCGSNLCLHVGTNRGGNRLGAYICNKYNHAKLNSENRRSCTTHYLKHQAICDITLERLNKIITSNLTEEKLIKMLKEDVVVDKSAKRKLEKLKRRDTELRVIVKKIVEQNALGEITQSTFAELYNNYRTEQATVSEQISALEHELSKAEDEKLNAQRFIETVRKYTKLEELSREVILDLIDKIVVHEPTGDQRNGTKEQVLEFYYRFIGLLPD